MFNSLLNIAHVDNIIMPVTLERKKYSDPPKKRNVPLKIVDWDTLRP